MFTPEQLAAIDTRLTALKGAITTAVAKETDEIKAAIQALKDQIGAGGSPTQADMDILLGKIDAVAPAATAAIDSISVNAEPAAPAPPSNPQP